MRNNRTKKEISGVLQVTNTKDGDSEFLVKKFIRKVRNSGVIEEFRARTRFVSKSQKRRAKKLEKEKINLLRKNFFNIEIQNTTSSNYLFY